MRRSLIVAMVAGACVVGAIEGQLAVLSDRGRTDAERRDALKYLTHFIADVHQPLHAGYAHDKGGNDAQINWNGRGTNMHTLWDSRMLVSTGRLEVDCQVGERPDREQRGQKPGRETADEHDPVDRHPRRLTPGGVRPAASAETIGFASR